MFYVFFDSNRADARAVAVTTEYPRDTYFQTRNDWKTFERAAQVAQELTEATGTLYIGIDQGSNVSPRYDVIEAPAVGHEVSRGFNGDYYPAGTITKVSDSLRRVETDQGVVFYRRRNSGTWLQTGGTFAMVRGHRDERNPSF